MALILLYFGAVNTIVNSCSERTNFVYNIQNKKDILYTKNCSERTKLSILTRRLFLHVWTLIEEKHPSRRWRLQGTPKINGSTKESKPSEKSMLQRGLPKKLLSSALVSMQPFPQHNSFREMNHPTVNEPTQHFHEGIKQNGAEMESCTMAITQMPWEKSNAPAPSSGNSLPSCSGATIKPYCPLPTQTRSLEGLTGVGKSH